MLIVFDEKISDMLSNKKLDAIVTELFVRPRKLNISLFLNVFPIQSYFAVPKNVRLNSTHCFITKILNRSKLQRIPSNNSSDIHFKDFMDLYKKCTAKSYSFLILLLHQIVRHISKIIF